MVLTDGIVGYRVNVALAFYRVYGDDKEVHQDTLAQHGWQHLLSRRARCARPHDVWPGRSCRQELSTGPVVCTHLMECSVEGIPVAFDTWMGRTSAWRFNRRR